MELPNNTHSSEAAKQMEFAEGFNPELATGEKLWAAAKFNDLVQSTLLRVNRWDKIEHFFRNSSRRRISCIGQSRIRSA